jgi:hypothetical protein
MEIIAAAERDVNIFTDYFLRSPRSGTRYNKVLRRAEWETLREAWVAAGKPLEHFVYDGVLLEVEWRAESADEPEFFHRHGWLFQDWQHRAFHCPQPEVTIIGGFGSGKTAWIAAMHVVLALTVPNYRGFCVAPQMMQVMEAYNYILTEFGDTPAFRRWCKQVLKKPAAIIFANDYIGESKIEFFSIERDPEKVRTLEGDCITLDQAEKIQELDETVRDLGSRLRGQVGGRAKLGKLILVANAGDNAQLWQRFDMAQWEPETYASFNPGSWDNKYLSERDLENLKRRVSGSGMGANAAQVAQWLGGARPEGSGRHFTAAAVRGCLDEGLDRLMDYHLELQEQDPSRPRAWKRMSAPRVGVYLWEAPPDHAAGRVYMVGGDPGQSNPPDRNSPPIMVWDITGFPSEPATLRAFHWVFAAGSYWTFLTEFERYVKTYRAHGRCAFDSTGMQKGFDELAFALMGLQAEGVNMNMSSKMLALNTLKLFLDNRLLRFPYISHLQHQLTSYELPDNKLRQDLVMCMAICALWMRRLYFADAPEGEEYDSRIPLKGGGQPPAFYQQDRYATFGGDDRYGGRGE